MMARGELVTRSTLRRELVVNAATKPVVVAVPSVVVVAALLIATGWLLPVAVVLYVALALTTLLDEDEAERVGKEAYERARRRRAQPAASDRVVRADAHALPGRLEPGLAALVERAEEQERLIREIVERDASLSAVAGDVRVLNDEMKRVARGAQLISRYLAEQKPHEVRRRLEELRRESPATAAAAEARERALAALENQLRVRDALVEERSRFRMEMEHLIASLSVIHGQLVRLTIANETQLQDAVAAEIRDLRDRISGVADEMGAAVVQADRASGTGI